MESILRESVFPEWLPILLMVCPVLVAAAKLADAKRFNEFILLPFTDKYFMVSGKHRKFFTVFNMLLFSSQVISFSLFIFYAVKLLRGDENYHDFFLFLRILSFLTLFIGVKYYLEKITAHLFSIDKLIDEYLYFKLSHKNWLGLLLLPANFLVFYTFRGNISIFVIVIILSLTINLFLLFYTFRKNQKTIVNDIFYFILYLCTLEISSYYLLYKLIVL